MPLVQKKEISKISNEVFVHYDEESGSECAAASGSVPVLPALQTPTPTKPRLTALQKAMRLPKRKSPVKLPSVPNTERQIHTERQINLVPKLIQTIVTLCLSSNPIFFAQLEIKKPDAPSFFFDENKRGGACKASLHKPTLHQVNIGALQNCGRES